MADKIWLASPHMGGNEQTYINQAFDTNWIAPLGPHVTGFEQDIESYLGNNTQVAALSSGTAALQLALILAGVKKDDVVLCQSFTFCGSANPIFYLGAQPVFIDSEPDTWNINPELLEQSITELTAKGAPPKALIVVHLYGMPAQMQTIVGLCKKYDIKVIEDAAEALGSQYHGTMCGALGDYGILSFNGNKIITTSGGGALVCKNKTDKDQAIFLATQARDNAPHYQHSQLGYNFRLSNVLAGIGRGQMEVLNTRISVKQKIKQRYKSLLEPKGYTFQQAFDNTISNDWLTAIITPNYAHRETLRMAFEKDHIESRPLWKPMHLQPLYAQCKSYTNGVSEDLFNRGLCLPSDTKLTDGDWERIERVLKDF